MKIAFISPAYPPEQRDFTRALAEEGATVLGVGSDPEEGLPDKVRKSLSGYLRIPHLFDEVQAARTLIDVIGDMGFDRVESNWEPLVLLAARVRDALGIPGMSRDAVAGFRDKQLMKERLRAAGLRVPRSHRVRTADGAREAAAQIGYPVILKPIAGAGSADTFRCMDAAELEAAMKRSQHVPECSLEEFVDGDEFTYDTVCIDGEPVFENVAQYFPRPLVFRSEQWISPAQIVYRNPYRPDLMGGIELGRNVMKTLGMGTGFTHMEWYRKWDGEVVFGEIACRNGGGHFVDMMNWANDFDVYRGWARAVLYGRFDQVPQRKYHVGMVFKRALGQGRITRIEGREHIHRTFGPWLVADELLPVGAQRRDWKQTLLSDGFVAVRHPDEGACRTMMEAVTTEVRMYAE